MGRGDCSVIGNRSEVQRERQVTVRLRAAGDQNGCAQSS